MRGGDAAGEPAPCFRARIFGRVLDLRVELAARYDGRGGCSVLRPEDAALGLRRGRPLIAGPHRPRRIAQRVAGVLGFRSQAT